MSAGLPINYVASIVNQLYDLLHEELIAQGVDRDVLIKARQKCNDLADPFVERMLNEHGAAYANEVIEMSKLDLWANTCHCQFSLNTGGQGECEKCGLVRLPEWMRDKYA
jgi:hypothetical protein